MRLFLACSCLLAAYAVAQQSAPPASGTQAIYQAAARSCQRKFDSIRQNGRHPVPKPARITISENEINSWLASGFANLPQGVKKLHVSSAPHVINATAYVDFDEVTAHRYSSNPLLYLFRGTHEVQASAHAYGADGRGHVQIDSVSIDGISVPQIALQYFVDEYIKPKHPQIGLNTIFTLPYKIDTATVGLHQLTIVQK